MIYFVDTMSKSEISWHGISDNNAGVVVDYKTEQARHMRSEYDWIKSHLQEDVYIFASTLEQHNNDVHWFCTPLLFTNKEDAALFKLTWC